VTAGVNPACGSTWFELELLGRESICRLKPNPLRPRLFDEDSVQGLAVSRTQSDRAGFDALIGPHLEAGYRTALAILRDPDLAHDAVQESAFKAWRKLHQLREGKPARPWFLTIVANQCRSERRTHWWSVIRQAEVEPAPSETQTDAIDIDRALAKLPADDRLALFLYFYLDLPLDEVGAVLGLSAAGAKTRIYRAAKKLRPRLELD
jgi:RNA polymerase sigma-70 factor (ECF subfamily)